MSGETPLLRHNSIQTQTDPLRSTTSTETGCESIGHQINPETLLSPILILTLLHLGVLAIEQRRVVAGLVLENIVLDHLEAVVVGQMGCCGVEGVCVGGSLGLVTYGSGRHGCVRCWFCVSQLWRLQRYIYIGMVRSQPALLCVFGLTLCFCLTPKKKKKNTKSQFLCVHAASSRSVLVAHFRAEPCSPRSPCQSAPTCKKPSGLAK